MPATGFRAVTPGATLGRPFRAGQRPWRGTPTGVGGSALGPFNADATGGEPIFKDGKGIGRVTSGAYGYSVGMSLALGFVRDVVPGDTVEVMVLGKPHKARVLAEPPFDPKGEKLRA